MAAPVPASVILPENVPFTEIIFFKGSLHDLSFEKEFVLITKRINNGNDRIVKLRIDTVLINVQVTVSILFIL